MSEPRTPLDLAAIRCLNMLAAYSEQAATESLQYIDPLCDEVEALRKALRDMLAERDTIERGVHATTCLLCHRVWPSGDPEQHADWCPGVLAASLPGKEAGCE